MRLIPDRKPERLGEDVVPPADHFHSILYLPDGRAFERDDERQDVFGGVFDAIARGERLQLVAAVAQLPNLGDIDTRLAQSLADVADDAGAILDDEANI